MATISTDVQKAANQAAKALGSLPEIVIRLRSIIEVGTFTDVLG